MAPETVHHAFFDDRSHDNDEPLDLTIVDLSTWKSITQYYHLISSKFRRPTSYFPDLLPKMVSHLVGLPRVTNQAAQENYLTYDKAAETLPSITLEGEQGSIDQRFNKDLARH